MQPSIDNRYKGSAQQRVYLIAGPTASGKTSFSIQLARRWRASGQAVEIVSADSRQIYKEIPIFSGALSSEEMCQIPHHIIGTESIVDDVKTATWFREEIDRLLREIHARGAVALVVGGSGFWIQSILFENTYPPVAPNEPLRKELAGFSLEDLQARLQALDPQRYRTIDTHNPRRLIRSIEIATSLGHVPPMEYVPNTDYLWNIVYFDYPTSLRTENIQQSVEQRFARGLVLEAKKVASMVSFKRMHELGLAYHSYSDFADGSINEEEWVKQTIQAEKIYAKRQKTFFDRLWQRGEWPIQRVCRREEQEQVLEMLCTPG